MKTVYVIGHRNPDSDSIISATAYARLKQLMGHSEYVAARAGNLSPQTEYIMNRFKLPIPQYVPDLIPKVSYYMTRECQTVSCDTSLWKAVNAMQEHDRKVMPVVQDGGKYVSLLHYSAFAKNVLQIVNPEKSAAISTTIGLISETISAQPVITFNEEETFRCVTLVAGSQFESFKKRLALHDPSTVIVITGDRKDIQEYCAQEKVRAIIITSGYTPDKELRALAEKNGVSLLVSPYDTSATSMLIIYSSPVSSMANQELAPLNANDTIKKVRPILQKAPGGTLPVIDDSNNLLGVISESDLLNEPCIEVCLVDHNELSQAVEGIENYKIREVIDHHRLGSFSTRYPITFINRPVGATCTIVTNLYRQHHVSIPKEIACILLCGILTDTLVLQSATTTDEDRETAEYLSNITNLDIQTLGKDIITASSSLKGRSAEDVTKQDMKEFNEKGHKFTVSQIEVSSPSEVLDRKEEFFTLLDSVRSSRGCLFSALMVTDIINLTSLMLVAADPAFLQVVEIPRTDHDNIFVLKNIVSRKKQLIPLLSEQIEKLENA